MTKVVKLFDKSRENIFTLGEIEEIIETLDPMMTQFFKKRDKLIDELSYVNPRGSEKESFVKKIGELEEKFKEKVAKLGGRMNSLNRIRFSSGKAFYIYDYRTKELEKVPYE